MEPQKEDEFWVFDEGVGMVNRKVEFVPGLYKIFDEILVNAADNKQRDDSMDTIKYALSLFSSFHLYFSSF